MLDGFVGYNSKGERASVTSKDQYVGRLARSFKTSTNNVSRVEMQSRLLN